VPKVLVTNRSESEFLSLTVTAALAYWHVSFQFPTWSSCHSNSLFCKRVSTLRLAGNKALSRDLVNSLGVPTAEDTRVFYSEDVRSFAALPQINYPVMVKVLDGGRGRGIRIVEGASSVDEAFKRCACKFIQRNLCSDSPPQMRGKFFRSGFC